jgi:hypothetical protein
LSQVKREIIVAVFDMGGEVEFWNKEYDLHLTFVIKTQRPLVVPHAFPQIFMPLTHNIVGYNEPNHADASDTGEKKIVHIGVPKITFNKVIFRIGNYVFTFRPFVDSLQMWVA